MPGVCSNCAQILLPGVCANCARTLMREVCANCAQTSRSRKAGTPAARPGLWGNSYFRWTSCVNQSAVNENKNYKISK